MGSKERNTEEDEETQEQRDNFGLLSPKKELNIGEITPKKAVSVDEFRSPEDSEKKKRLNAELLRLSQEIHFEQQARPVLIQQVQAFNPFKNLVSSSEPSQSNSVNWEEMAKLWMKSVEDSSNVCDQLEECEKIKKTEEAETQKRILEEEIQKKKEAAQAIVEKMLNAQKQKEMDNKIPDETEEGKEPKEILKIEQDLPKEPSSESFLEESTVAQNESISPERYRSRSRSFSRSRSKSWSSRRSASYSSRSKSPLQRRRSRSRSRRRSFDRRRSRSRERRNYIRPEFRRGPIRGRRGVQDRRYGYRRNTYRMSPPHERHRIRSPVVAEREKSYSASPPRSTRRSESPRKNEVAESDVPAVETIEEDPPVPSFEHIYELVYLDKGKESKMSKKLRRTSDPADECGCFDRGLNCSDNRCANRHLYIECRKGCRAPTCENQMFRKKEYAKIEPFYTGPKKGFGIRALEYVKKDKFIIEYIGEVVTNEEFAERAKRYAKNPKHTHHYIFELGHSLIDATVKGNFSRFINHSCDPNAICLKYSAAKTPEDCPRIGFFAKRDIIPGEEITFDYQFLNYGKKAQTCHCGALACKGVIGQTLDENEEDVDDEEDADEEESDCGEDTEEDRPRKEREAEIREWDSQSKINEIMHSDIPDGKRFIWAGRFVKNLMKVDEIDYKLRVLSYIQRADKSFYNILKKKSLFDVFASWLSPNNWSKEDMKLKLELLRFLSTEVSYAPYTQGDNITSGWTALSVQSVDNLAASAVPSVLVIRDTVDFLVNSVCEAEEENGFKIGIENTSYESLFASVQDATRLLIENNQFAEVRRRCAMSKYKIPKKIKKEREAAAQNPTSSCRNQTKEVQRTERRDDYFAWNRRRNASRPFKRRFEFRKSYENEQKRGRFGRDHHYEREHHRRRNDDRSPERRRRYRSGDGKMPEKGAKLSRSHFSHSRSTLQEPGLFDPRAKQMAEDMDLSDGSPKTPKEEYSINPALNIDVCAESPFGSNPLLSSSSAYLNSIHAQTAIYSMPYGMVNGDYPKQEENWAINVSESQIFNQYSALPLFQLMELKEFYHKALKAISQLEEMHRKKNLPVAKPEAHVPPPPPPKKQSAYCRLKSAEGDFYYWNRETNATTWDLPEGESFEDFENNPLPDSSAEVEEKNSSFNEGRSPSRNSCSPSQVSGEMQNTTDEKNNSFNSKPSSEDFLHSIEKAIAPVIINGLKKVFKPDAPQRKEKTEWLIRVLVKDLHRRETTREDCPYVLNSKTLLKMTKFVEDYIKRKGLNNGKELFKQYHPSRSHH